MAWIRKLLKVKPDKATVYTLDHDGGIVASREVLVKSNSFRKQIDAANALYHKERAKRTAAAGGE